MRGAHWGHVLPRSCGVLRFAINVVRCGRIGSRHSFINVRDRIRFDAHFATSSLTARSTAFHSDAALGAGMNTLSPELENANPWRDDKRNNKQNTMIHNIPNRLRAVYPRRTILSSFSLDHVVVHELQLIALVNARRVKPIVTWSASRSSGAGVAPANVMPETVPSLVENSCSYTELSI